MSEDAVDVLNLGESEGPESAVPDNANIEDPSRGTKVLDVKASGEGGLDADEEGGISADENVIVDVDGHNLEKTCPSDGKDCGVNDGLKETE